MSDPGRVCSLKIHKIRNRIFLVSAGLAAVGGICVAAAFAFGAFGGGETLRLAAPAVPAGASPASSSASSPAAASSRSPASSAAQNVQPPAAGSQVPPLPAGRVVYMTFDDGPSDLTVPLLNVLDQYRVKATFFVVGTFDKNETADLKEIAGRGHAIGVHSYTHDYRKIYASGSAFFEDADKMHSLILDATGVDTKLFRFAGGSINDYNRRISGELKKGLKQRGYVYYDWNVSSGDGSAKTSAANILKNSLDGVRKHRVSVVLFHNSATKQATLGEIPAFIRTLQGEGYRFAALDPPVDSTPFVFGG